MARVKVFVTGSIPDRGIYFLGGYDRIVRLWEISNGQCFRSIPFNDSVWIGCLWLMGSK